MAASTLTVDYVRIRNFGDLHTDGATGTASSAPTTSSASAPTHGVTTTINTDNTTLVATVEVGKKYRVTVRGGEGVCIANAAAAARATDEMWNTMMKFEFIAVATTLHGQKYTAGTTDAVVNTVPLDGGTIA